MPTYKNIFAGLGVAVLTASAAATANATDLVPAGSSPEFSVTAGGTSDYVFRGFSQSDEDPVFQGSVDMTYGLFYAGAWVSGIEFGQDALGRNVANAELDLYGGVTPKIGMFDLDFGFIWYLYPGARDPGAELDYVELKAGASTEIFKSMTAGVTYYYSPEFTGETGTAHAIEGSLGYEFPAIGSVTPSISGLIGHQIVDDLDFSASADQEDSYTYWNVGIGLGWEKLSLDFRYWDTDIDDTLCTGPLFQCDERFVFSASVSLP
ncbi:MAG: TorF family putative porin [Hyphomicrobiaceae bacterium]